MTSSVLKKPLTDKELKLLKELYELSKDEKEVLSNYPRRLDRFDYFERQTEVERTA